MPNFYLKVPTNDNDIIASADTSNLLLWILSLWEVIFSGIRF